jgi:hypothetical protein
MRTIHERATAAAHNAAWAASDSEHWLTCGESGKEKKKARDKAEPELLRFVLDNAGAPAEALYIRAGALGLHDGQPFAEVAPETRIGYQAFMSVFLHVSDVLDQLAAGQAAIDAAAAAAAMPARVLTEDDLEGTPFEKLPDPRAPSEFAKAANSASDTRDPAP